MDFLASHQVRFDSETSRLRAENHALAEELNQCKADKEFVWSLWKRLQVASPDITQAIGMVVNREKEKAEQKDHKVLQILASKDAKISDLQETVRKQSEEISALVDRKADIQKEAARLQQEKAIGQDHLSQALEKLQDSDRRELARLDVLKEKEALLHRVTRHETELDGLKHDKEDMRIIRDTQAKRIKQLEEDLSMMGENYDKLAQENHNVKQHVRMGDKLTEDLKLDVRGKDKELDSIRKELSELWQTHNQTTEHCNQQAELIKQLQALQKDTHKMLKNQEDAFSMETSSLQSLYKDVSGRYQNLKAGEIDLKNKLINCQKKLTERGRELQRVRDESQNRSVSTQASMGQEDKEVQAWSSQSEVHQRLQESRLEVNTLRNQLKKKKVPTATLR